MRQFPNQIAGTVSLSLATDYSGEATLTLYDLTGRQVKTQALTLAGKAGSTGIDLSGVPGGMYLLKVQAGQWRWQERVVVK